MAKSKIQYPSLGRVVLVRSIDINGDGSIEHAGIVTGVPTHGNNGMAPVISATVFPKNSSPKPVNSLRYEDGTTDEERAWRYPPRETREFEV